MWTRDEAVGGATVDHDNDPQPNHEVKVGFVAAGSQLHFYVRMDTSIHARVADNECLLSLAYQLRKK